MLAGFSEVPVNVEEPVSHRSSLGGEFFIGSDFGQRRSASVLSRKCGALHPLTTFFWTSSEAVKLETLWL